MMNATVKNKVRLYIVEEQEVFRQAYKAFFPAHQKIELMGIIDNEKIELTIAALKMLRINTLLLGSKKLTPEAVEKLEIIRDNDDEVGIVYLSSYYDLKGIKRLREFTKRGARGCAYLLKQSLDSMNQLAEVIMSAADGRVILDPVVMEGLIDTGETNSTILKELTTRELEVLNLMTKGYRNYSIAEILCIDLKTVERHINNIYSKISGASESMHPRVAAAMQYLRATGQLPVEITDK